MGRIFVEGEEGYEPCPHTFRGGESCILVKGHGGPHGGLVPTFKGIPLFPGVGGTGRTYEYDESQVMAFVDGMIQLVTFSKQIVNKGMFVWIARMQFDAVTMGYEASRVKHISVFANALGIVDIDIPDIPPIPEPVTPEPILSPRDFFFKMVEGKPFGQQTLLGLEHTLNMAGWLLTPPNSRGERTKVHPPNGPWVRVGFGEGHWVWIEQALSTSEMLGLIGPDH